MSRPADRDAPTRPDGRLDALRDRLPLGDSLVLWGVAAAVLVALVLRLVFLGDRVAHYDEGRVAYWALHTLDTGHFAYRRIIHGPFIQHVDRYLFAFVGATDFVSRFPVAVVGGLLPASALLFRRHLRRTEVVAMAFVLALNPVLLYYSRFMRSDILVGAFMFVALGFLVRFYDTRRHRYLYAATAFVVLGFGSKENAIVYVLTWLGAAGLLADQALFRPREYDTGTHLLYARGTEWLRDLRATFDRGWRFLLRYVWYGVVVTVIAVALFLWLYAPRGAGYDGLTYPLGDAAAHLGLWDAVGNPTQLPALLDATWDRFYGEFVRWFNASSEPGCHKDNVIDGWLCYAGRYVWVMIGYAGPLTAFAVFGFLTERYGALRTRNLVLFAAYGGFVSIVGYPLGTDVWGAWIVVHALIPLSIPAAVGIGVIVRWGREADDVGDRVGVGIAVGLLLLATGVAGFVMVDAVYTNHQSEHNDLVQYAQPGGQMGDILATMETAAADNDGTDVLLYYGERGSDYVENNALVKESPTNWDWAEGDLAKDPMCSRWHNLLPLPWYFANDDATVECSINQAELEDAAAGGEIPVVVTSGDDDTIADVDLEANYESRTYRLRTTDTPITYHVSDEYADGLADR